MAPQYIAISLNPDDEYNSFDSSTISQTLKDAYFEASVYMLEDTTGDLSPVFDILTAAHEKYIVESSKEMSDLYSPKSSQSLGSGSSSNVVQIGADGNILLSNSTPTFAKSKEEVKNILGGVEKIGDNEILVADSVNKRLIIVDTTENTVMWEYNSDRYVVDARMIPNDEVEINVYDTELSSDDIILNQNQVVIWKNVSSQPIYVYSGTTTQADFLADPDLDLYGDVFKSQELAVGERFSYRFTNNGAQDWFIYPMILTGEVTVSNNKISSANQFVLLESDGKSSQFSSRVVKIDTWGNILWKVDGIFTLPRDVRTLNDNKYLVST